MSSAMSAEPVRHRWTVEDYHRMAEAGLLAEDIRVELVDGELVDMAPIGSLHAGTVKRLMNLLAFALYGQAIVAAQDPVILDARSELQPGIAVLKLRNDYYTASHPRPEDLLLLIEVSDSPVRYDREVKIPLYARAGITEVWLMDLPNRQLEIYRDPSLEGYRQILKPRMDSEVSPTPLPDLRVDPREMPQTKQCPH